MEYECKEMGIYYGYAIDTIVNTPVIGSPSSSSIPQYLTLNALLSYGTILNTIRMETFIFLVA